jgi:hypothetical protein
MATVPRIAIGIMREGLATSSARCVAQSRHAKAQFVFMRPTMNAIEGEDQPVLFVKVAKTKEGGWWVGATEGMVMRIVRKERRLM